MGESGARRIVKRSNQLIAESTIIGAFLIMAVVGGAVTGMHAPAQWTIIQNPNNVTVKHDSGALALYYNTTLSALGEGRFGNVSLLLRTFRFVNIQPSVNQTAQVANEEVANVNVSIPLADIYFSNATRLIGSNEFVQAVPLVNAGCALAKDADGNLTQFQTSTTAQFGKFGVPVQLYRVGGGLAAREVASLTTNCQRLSGLLPTPSLLSASLILLISSPQKSIETGGSVQLLGNLTRNGVGVGGRDILFYLNGTYFGTLVTEASGDLKGALGIPFVYKPVGVVSAYAVGNSTVGPAGAASNHLTFAILFNATSIAVGDPPAVLPTFSFPVEGNLTTISGIPLPSAPVKVTFLRENVTTTTDQGGAFRARFTVPANATDGIYYVYASFAPMGVFGPSFNFTSVQVVHVPLDLSIGLPKLAFAGFSLPVSGRAVANGSGLAGVAIAAVTPWGAYQGRSGADGNFSLQIPVPVWEFSFGGRVSVTAAPVQPYIAHGSAQAKAGLFNLLIVALPAMGVGAIAYGFRSLGLLPRPRRETAEAMIAAEKEKEQVDSLTALEQRRAQSTGILSIFFDALILAQQKFGIAFKESDTLREALAKVEKQHAKGGGHFSSIVRTTEDFLYAPRFDEARVREAEQQLAELMKAWGGGMT